MHQIADQCRYDLSEAERQPILQAEALKEKDKAIARLRNELEILRGHPIKTEPLDDLLPLRSTQKIRLPPKVPIKPLCLNRKRLHGGAAVDSIYFGSPGMTNVIEEVESPSARHGPWLNSRQFAHLSVDRNAANFPQSVPRGADIFAFQLTTSHPFPTLWSAKDETAGLVELLPSNEDIHFYLASFQRRVQSCSFPHLPDECTEAEVRRFLDNIDHNAAVHPNMLALLFATLAQGLQDGVYDRNGEKWIAGSVEAESQKGDVYSRSSNSPRRRADELTNAVAAAMQALRLAAFLNRPTLLTIQTLIMMGPYLTNCGKFLDASAMFGVTVRLAQSIGRTYLAVHPQPTESEF